MIYRTTITSMVCIATLLASVTAGAQSTCDLRGTWELVAGRWGDNVISKDVKVTMVANGTHFTTTGRYGAPPATLHTVADTLAVYRAQWAESGRYSIKGSSYIEHVDFHTDPNEQGRVTTLDCRASGDRVYMSGMAPRMKASKKVGELRAEGEWRRVGQP